jgi:exodeoxyribonuclease VII large subunit
LIRGGGSRTDLAAFDSRTVAEAVARSRWPVITGIGHEIDESIADRVAHTAVKTPTRAAELLVERVSSAEGEMEAVRTALVHRAGQRLLRTQQSVRTAEREIGVARFRLREAAVNIGRLAADAGRAAAHRLAAARTTIAGIERLCAQIAPQRTLARGFSLTRDSAGRLVRAAAEVIPGDQIITELAEGHLVSRVEEP